MKKLILIALSTGALSLTSFAAQEATTAHPQFTITSSNVARIEGSVTHLSGKVVVKTDGIVLEADEVDFHSDTRNMEARGNVIVRHLSGATSTSTGSTASLDAQIAALRTEKARLLSALTTQSPRVQAVQMGITRLELEIARGAEQDVDQSGWTIRTDTLKMQLPQSKP